LSKLFSRREKTTGGIGTQTTGGIGTAFTRPPEFLLRRPKFDFSGDVWGMALIFSKIIQTRTDSLKNIEYVPPPKEALKEARRYHPEEVSAIKNWMEGALAFIPEGEGWEEDILPILKDCLQIDPSTRPDFYDLVKRLQEVQKKHGFLEEGIRREGKELLDRLFPLGGTD
jgi:hypothetical protein